MTIWRRLGTPALVAAAFAVALAPAHAGDTSNMTPYEPLPASHTCAGQPVDPMCENAATSGADGHLTTVAELTSVLSDGRADSRAGVMARHTLVQPVQQVTYTVMFDVETALATASADAGATGRLLVSVTGPQGCAACSAGSVRALVDAGPGETASLPDGEVAVEVTLRNGATAKVPAGQVEIRVRLEAVSTASSLPHLGFIPYYIDSACGNGPCHQPTPLEDPPSVRSLPAHARADVDGVVTRISVAEVPTVQ